jgi:hypothetical protein
MQEPLFVGALDKQRFSVGCNDRLAAKQGTVNAVRYINASQLVNYNV